MRIFGCQKIGTVQACARLVWCSVDLILRGRASAIYLKPCAPSFGLLTRQQTWTCIVAPLSVTPTSKCTHKDLKLMCPTSITPSICMVCMCRWCWSSCICWMSHPLWHHRVRLPCMRTVLLSCKQLAAPKHGFQWLLKCRLAAGLHVRSTPATQ